MYDTLGELKQRSIRKRNLFVSVSIILLSVGVSLWFLFNTDPDESPDPLDFVQGTGVDMEGFQMVYEGPSELEVRWDEVIGQAWSIAYVSGWVRNTSQEAVECRNIVYRVKDPDGNIMWEITDERFSGGFDLQPGSYIDFDVLPICKRSAEIFELSVEVAVILNQVGSPDDLSSENTGNAEIINEDEANSNDNEIDG